MRGPSLPNYTNPQPTPVYGLPLKIPNHYFIYDDLKIRRYKNTDPVDEKDIDYLYEQDFSVQPLEDEFEGWSKG